MSELPEGWAATTLGEIVALRGEKSDPAKVPDLPFIGLDGIEPHTSQIISIGKAYEVKSSVALFDAGEVLYSRLRPYLNKVAVPDFTGVASAEILVLQASDATDKEFVRRRLMTNEFLDFAALLDKGDRPRVNYKDISKFQIALPPLREQRRIMAKVDGLTARTARARKDLDRIPTLIARYKSAILALAFKGDLTNDYRKRNGVVEGRSSDFPPNWVAKPLGEISEIQGGIQVGKKRPSSVVLVEVPYLRVANVQRGWLNLDEIKTLRVTPEERDRLLLREGDVLMNEGGDRDKLGRGWVWREEVPTCIHQNHVFRIRLTDETFPPEFVSHYANENGQQYFIDQGKQTTNLASISKKKISALPVPVPPNDEAVEIVRRIEAAFAWLDRVATDHASADRLLPKLDAAILERAFRGELLPQDPNDEPASILLERIKAGRAAAPRKAQGRQAKGPRKMSAREKPMQPHERLLQDSEGWPAVGLPYEAIAMRNSGISHDEMRDALFRLMSGPEPTLKQRFDKDAHVMVIQRVAA